MIVAVVGGTGTIGRVVVENLERRGHHPRVLSRRPPEHSDRTHHRVDLTTGDGLEEALTGVETVVDASNPGSPTKDAAAAVLLEGTQRLLAAETSTGVSRHVLMSIVGAEAIPFPYHRFKVQQEALVARSGLGWSIVRATQFHQLIDFLFRSTSRWGLLPKAGIPLQPVDPRDVAPVVSSAVENGSSGQRLQIVGPQTLGLAELAEMWRLRNRSLALPLPIPLFGDFGRALKSGELTNTAAPKGLITFSDWLDEHIPLGACPGMSRTGDHAAFFEGLRPYLLRVAYTQTGSVADSEDVVQEAWLRYDRVDRSGIENPKAWLTTVVTRLALDSLGSAHSRRESYVGEWLPEPLVTTAPSSDPAERVTLDESVSMALMVLLESVSPAERCAFVLHDIFGFRFEEVSRVVGRTPEAVRQLASRARRHVEAGRPRFPPTPQEHYRVVEAFRQATHAGDVEALIKLLDPRVRVRADGGGVVPSIRRAIVGAPRAAQVLNALARRFPDREELPVEINGALGLVVRVGDQLSVMSFTIDSGLITEVDIFRNPHKLAHVDIP